MVCGSPECEKRIDEYVEDLGASALGGRISSLDDTGDLPGIPASCRDIDRRIRNASIGASEPGDLVGSAEAERYNPHDEYYDF